METDPEYGHAFAKVRMNGTVYREMADSTKKVHQGFYVDILPYDNIPDDKEELAQMAERIMECRTLMHMKGRLTPWKTNPHLLKRCKSYFHYLKIRIRASKIPRQQLIDEFNKNMLRYNDSVTNRVCQESGGARFGKYPIDRSLLTEFTMLDFEDDKFQCPKDYDKFLRSIYGDYMQLPPEEKRVCTHGIIDLKFREDTK